MNGNTTPSNRRIIGIPIYGIPTETNPNLFYNAELNQFEFIRPGSQPNSTINFILGEPLRIESDSTLRQTTGLSMDDWTLDQFPSRFGPLPFSMLIKNVGIGYIKNDGTPDIDQDIVLELIKVDINGANAEIFELARLTAGETSIDNDLDMLFEQDLTHVYYFVIRTVADLQQNYTMYFQTHYTFEKVPNLSKKQRRKYMRSTKRLKRVGVIE